MSTRSLKKWNIEDKVSIRGGDLWKEADLRTADVVYLYALHDFTYERFHKAFQNQLKPGCFIVTNSRPLPESVLKAEPTMYKEVANEENIWMYQYDENSLEISNKNP